MQFHERKLDKFFNYWNQIMSINPGNWHDSWIIIWTGAESRSNLDKTCVSTRCFSSLPSLLSTLSVTTLPHLLLISPYFPPLLKIYSRLLIFPYRPVNAYFSLILIPFFHSEVKAIYCSWYDHDSIFLLFAFRLHSWVWVMLLPFLFLRSNKTLFARSFALFLIRSFIRTFMTLFHQK
jgi:hypothetical protein